MQTQSQMRKFSLLAALALGTLVTEAQEWYDTGNPSVSPGTHFLGSLNNADIDIRTNDIHRFRLLPDATYTINGFPNQVKDGSVLICPDVSTFVAPGPFGRLHLADGIPWLNNEEYVYRDWMENGITMTGNGDGMYVGQMYHEENVTDATITWSEDFMVDPFNATTSLVV